MLEVHSFVSHAYMNLEFYEVSAAGNKLKFKNPTLKLHPTNNILPGLESSSLIHPSTVAGTFVRVCWYKFETRACKQRNS